MEALVSEPERLQNKLAFTRGYVSAIAAVVEPASHSAPFERIKVLLSELEAICRQVGPNIKARTDRAASSNDEAAVRKLLVRTVMVVDNLRALADFRRQFPFIAPYWPESSQRVLEETLDLFEEAQETLALGVSAEFRSDIEQARSEAGVEGAQADLPAR